MSDLILPQQFMTRAQLLNAGLTPGALRSLVRRGELHRVLHDVYAAVTPELLSLADRCGAAQVYANGGLAFSCATAAALWGAAEQAGPVHAICAEGRRVRSTTGLVVHEFPSSEHAPTLRRGHRVVSREQSIIQAFGCLPMSDRGAYVLAAIQEGLVRAQDVSRLVHPCTKGRRELLDLLHLAATGTHSAGELRMLVRALLAHGLPMPQRQYPVHLPSGGVVYLDAAYVRAKVGLEYDGRRHHFTDAARLADISRDAELAAEAWLILRCTDVQLQPGRAGIFAAQVRRAVESRGGF